MMDYQQLIASVQQFIFHRLEHYFEKREKGPSLKDFRLDQQKGNPFYKLTRSYQLGKEEQLLLGLALIPHLNPALYSNLIRHFLPQGGDLPIFGAAKGKNHRGVIPTGETAQFILGGTDINERLRVANLLKESELLREQILILEGVPAGEPEMSGKLTVANEYVDLFLTGEISTPSFGPDFPAQKIETERDWEDLVLSDDVKEQIEELKIWMKHNDRLMKGDEEKVEAGL